MKVLTAALLFAGCAVAQMKLYVLEGAQEREITGSFYHVGNAGPADLIATRFRARNVGASTIAVRAMSIAGTGFELTRPSLPYVLAPGGAPMEFTVRFSAIGNGSYSASLTVDSLTILVLSTVLNAPALSREGNSLPSGVPISLGRVQRGQRESQSFLVENRGSDPLTVQRLEVSGAAFRYIGPAVPIALAPRTFQRFEIEFAPPGSVDYNGVLQLDSRAFPLTGSGFDPPLPKPSILIDGTPASGQQAKVSVRLATPAASVVSGVLRMTFRPLSADLPDDPAIRLMTSGGRTINVQTREGDQRVWIAGAAVEETFQTGTTAGSITWTLELGTHTETQSVALPAVAAVVDQATAARRVQDLDVSLSGFDNTRSVSQALFTFFDAGGRPLAPGTIRADVKREFSEFFKSSTTTGGVFTMRATFPVQGGAASQVAGVDVEIVNNAGGTRTQRLTFGN